MCAPISGGEDSERSYPLRERQKAACASPSSASPTALLALGQRHAEGRGTLEVMPPAGRFVLPESDGSPATSSPSRRVALRRSSPWCGTR